MLPNKKLIVKDNSLIDASFNLGLVEQRIMLLAIVAARELPTLTVETPIEITVKDYIQQYSISEATAYETIQVASEVLFGRQFSYLDRYKGSDALTKSRWVNKITYVKDAGVIVLHLSSEVIGLISRLESQFTRYRLDQVSGFKSKYSIRLYELVLKWASAGKTEKYEIADLKSKLGVGEDEYKQYSDFNKRVLQSAKNEINNQKDQTDISIEIEQFKRGRVVTHVQFKIKQKNMKVVRSDELDYKMSASQIEMFGDILANDPNFQNYFLAEVGESLLDYSERIKAKLAKEANVKEWYQWLLRVDFKAKKKKPKMVAA